MTTIDIEKLSPADLEKLQNQIVQRQEKEQKAREKERKNYEAERNAFTVGIFNEAKELSELISKFKTKVSEGMQKYSEKLAEYGEMRSTSLGGFSLFDESKELRIRRTRDTEPIWDERAVKGIELIHSFLMDTVKKRDTELFEILISFLERNQAGELEVSRVMNLMQHEGKFNDDRWIEGLRLLKESFSTILKGYGYLFQYKGVDSKWKTLTMNFSSL
ncbi:DUF3164 family protein [Empedobacter brevis]